MATKLFAYISPLCQEAPLGQIYIRFFTRGRLTDVINHAEFYLNQLRGFDSVGVKFLAFPWEKEVALNKWLELQGAAKKSSPLKFFAIFSAIAWNFNMKFYRFIYRNVLHLTAK